MVSAEEAERMLALVRRERVHCVCTRTNTEAILIDDSGNVPAKAVRA